MSCYLVTGGAGFIGSNLVRFLLRQGQSVIILDDFSTGKEENLAGIREQATIVRGDIRDRDLVRHVMGKSDAVFHEAAVASVPKSIADPDLTHDVNVNGTLNVLEAARANGVRRIIFASSSSIYGDQDGETAGEQMAPRPSSPYAASKLACEAYMRGYAAVYGLETLCLRYFNVFGPSQDSSSEYAAVISKFACAALHGKQPVVFGDGEQTRDFCHIDNVTTANWLAAGENPKACNGQAINIACGRSVSLNMVLGWMSDLVGDQLKPKYEDRRMGDIRQSSADISLSAELIGYEPTVHFEEGLRTTMAWYRAQFCGDASGSAGHSGSCAV